jgi:hypothetical protein
MSIEISQSYRQASHIFSHLWKLGEKQKTNPTKEKSKMGTSGKVKGKGQRGKGNKIK